jgi:hypothetical protein
MHIDDFIDNEFGRSNYARFFFFLHRLPAVLQCDFSQWISEYKLFCTYKGKVYRVTGASRMGDVWLAEDFTRENGYDLRVDVEACSAFCDIPYQRRNEMTEYEQYKLAVMEGALARLKLEGVRQVCTDKIQECFEANDPVQDAIDTVFLDTLYWEGKL